jgi:hypothetical protein
MKNILGLDGSGPMLPGKLDYLRRKCRVSLRGASRLWITAAALAAFALPAAAQYQGQIDTGKNSPQMRAVGVFEWTGDQDHPKNSRLVPICIFDGQDLQDASVYMAQPAPLALESDVEYQLMKDGRPVGLFDISGAANQLGLWIGEGAWKPLPKPKSAAAQLVKIDADNDAQSDEPVLHRKQHADDPGAKASAPDTDRPTLHKEGDASGSSSGDSSSSGTDANSPAPDPDRPILKPTPDNSSTSSANSDNGKKQKKNSDDDTAYVENVATVTDPSRPHLFRGKASGFDAPLLPSLVGLPPDMHQEVAVSDAVNRPLHVWDYSWANPADEATMKADMEDLARTALGLAPAQPATPAKAAAKTGATHKTTRLKLAPPPAPLDGEKFRVFELAYGSGATMVLSAHTGGSDGPMKFVTLVGQPDLYGNVAVLLKNVADAAHLDDKPRMQLIDAVDARADNRGDLLFELRGATERQFALYRVLRGEITRIFLTSAQTIAIAAPNQ